MTERKAKYQVTEHITPQQPDLASLRLAIAEQVPSRSQTGNPWLVTNRVDPAVARMADDHYSRKTRGARQFAAPGRVLVLYIPGAC